MIAPTGHWIGTENFGHHDDHALCEALQVLFAGQTVIDLGCGNGYYVREFRKSGILALGIDGNPATPQFNSDCYVGDLATRTDRSDFFDWVLSLEVAEHIPLAFEAIYLDNIGRLGSRGAVISWAVPGQTGYGHVNERPNEYAIARMGKMGFAYQPIMSKALRSIALCGWFPNTLMVFLKRPS